MTEGKRLLRFFLGANTPQGFVSRFDQLEREKGGWETYIIKGERGSGKICLNGAAARRVQPDDIVIIMSYALMDFEEAKSFKPTVIFPDPATNKVVK